jgi:hypothetical protein
MNMQQIYPAVPAWTGQLWLRRNWLIAALLCVACIPAIYIVGILPVLAAAVACWFAFMLVVAVLQSNTLALGVIFVFAMVRGAAELAGIPTILTRAVAEAAILVLFFKAIYVRGIVKGMPLRVIGLLPMTGLFVVSLLSMYVNGLYAEVDSVVSFFLFLRDVFLYYCLFIAVLNLDLTDGVIHLLNRLLMVLFVIQIPAAVVKYVVVGVRESNGVGTVSLSGGGYATVVPLFAIAFLFAFYRYKRSVIYLLLILGFVFFGWVGEKRAVPFLVPVTMLVTLLVQRDSPFRKWNWDSIRAVVITVIIGTAALYLFTRTLHSLNPEQRYGGTFSPVHAARVVVDYEAHSTDAGQAEGRFACTLRAYEILKDGGLEAALLGLGPGRLRESPLTSTVWKEEWMRLGMVRGYTGFVWLTLQAGVLGALLVLAFYFRLFRLLQRTYRTTRNLEQEPWLLGLLVATCVLIVDFVIYSNIGMFHGTFTPVYFYLVAICLRRQESQSLAAAGW